jgi:hypothetical protein
MYSILRHRQPYLSLTIVLRLLGLFVSQSFSINLREEIIKNKATIKRNWQLMVHKSKKKKHNTICVGHH